MASRTAAGHGGYGQVGCRYRADRSVCLRQPRGRRRDDGSDCAARPAGPGRSIEPGPPTSEGKWAGMSISRRIATLFRVKANKALDRAEDPR